METGQMSGVEWLNMESSRTKEFPNLSGAMDELTLVLDEMALNWLQESQPALATAILRAVARGATPESISRHVLSNHGSFEAAKKCRAAARHLLREKTSE